MRIAGVPLGRTYMYADFRSTTIYFLTGFSQLVTTVSISVSIAMYCLLQLYFVISADIAPHRPLLQLFSVKAVVFLTFWQGALLGVLASFGVVKDVCGINLRRLESANSSFVRYIQGRYM